MRDPLHILVVDDNPAVCEVIRQMLADSGFRASGAENGAAMRRRLAEEVVDLVIVDMSLPGESGLSLARHARSRDVRVIVMTGDPGQRERIEADDFPYIFKPFRIAELLQIVADALAGASDGTDHPLV
jgi:DNA-binding response OmpR family regulator